MEIFNTKILNNRQRWKKALICAILATIVSSIVIGMIQHLLHITSSLFSFALAFFISYVILETGHGVQKKFSILAVICTIVAIIISDAIGYFGIYAFSHPLMALYFVISDYLSVDISNLLSLLLKGLAVYYAYGKARVL
ncbi:MAG: hypothetical protein ACI4U3_05120 [Traorella sp.]